MASFTGAVIVFSAIASTGEANCYSQERKGRMRVHWVVLLKVYRQIKLAINSTGW